ncbi:MAG: patatin-like phospholipase family protein [Granulosicoccaceae bacterium]|jgi:NTE family protein
MTTTRPHPYLMLFVIVCLAGCTTVPPALVIEHPPQETPPAMTFNKRPVIAYALGGGATRGFAHVGVLNVLADYGIHPDLIVGTSAGAVTGVLYAGGIRGKQLEDIANHLEREQIADWSYSGRGLIRGELLQDFINTLLQHRPIERLDIPFAATATDLQSGKLVAFTRGNAGLATRVSSTIPGLVSPVTINGRDYVDGGLVSKVPVLLARQLGADIVIAVDVSRRPTDPVQLDSTLAVMQQALSIMSQAITAADLQQADVVIRPDLGALPFGDFELKPHSIQAGRDAATVAVPLIKHLLNEKTKRPGIKDPQ